jgi:hypothetical protein
MGAIRTAPSVVAWVSARQWGTRFWHETYFRGGGVEAVYVDMQTPIGMTRFAPVVPARGAMFSARKRSALAGEAMGPEAVTEDEFYSK